MRELTEALTALLSRLLLGPLTWIVPRNPRRFAVLGRGNGMYVDNTKHFFAWLQDNVSGSFDIAFHSDIQWVRKSLLKSGATAFPASGPLAWWNLLRAGTIVVDSSEWRQGGRLGASRGARIVQIWHGIALKEIELPLFRHAQRTRPAWLRALLSVSKTLTMRFQPYDILISTSPLVTSKSLGPCIPAKSIVNTGYPRNDAMLLGWRNMSALARIGVDGVARDRLEKHRTNGGKTLLYAPTFRKLKQSPFGKGRFEVETIADWASSVGVLVALKLHPSMTDHRDEIDDATMVWIDPVSDVYPVLPNVDVLITDYSSIYFDFLLLNRPIAFFPYDLAEYTSSDRRLLFDYQRYAPGPKAGDIGTLMTVLEKLVAGEDEWSRARNAVAVQMHTHRDSRASYRLFSHLEGDPEL